MSVDDVTKKTQPTFPNCNLINHSFHPINETISFIVNWFIGKGFKIEFGSEITNVDNNFNHLCIDENHPSRSTSDSFFFSENELLRTHCTSHSIKKLRSEGATVLNRGEVFSLLTVGNVFRNDDDDHTHSHQFVQVDFVLVHKTNIANLKWLISNLVKELFGERDFRYRNSFFPFTQPSFEVDIKCCEKGCDTCKFSQWIEILGCGIFKNQILECCKIDSSKFYGLAGGLGVERIAMLRHNIKDVRMLYSNNFCFLNGNY